MASAAIDYPSTLPNPQVKTFRAAPEPRTWRTSLRGNPSRFRNRNKNAPIIVTLQWVFKQVEFTEFNFWFETTINQGEFAFNVNLPGSTGVESFCAHFIGIFQYSIISNQTFRVDAQLEITQNLAPEAFFGGSPSAPGADIIDGNTPSAPPVDIVDSGVP